MSTRSGKRLHNSSNENIEPELTSKRDRKTRNKRVVENGDGQEVVMKLKKRQNYVSFPTEEAQEIVSVNSISDEVEVKPIRALRRNTLKEQNAATEEVDTTNNIKKQTRTTRRTKKFSETAAEEVSDIRQTESHVDVVNITKSKKDKKNKKKSKKIEVEVINNENVELAKKKKSKKKKNSKCSLVDQEETRKVKNDSVASTDSFHSAAGSPVQNNIVSPLNKSSPKTVEAEALPTHNLSGNKKRRSSLRTSQLNTTTTVSMEVDDVNANIDKETVIVITKENKRRRSSLKVIPDKNSNLPDTVDKVDLNATFEKEPISEGPIKKKRKSNMATDNMDIPVKNNSLLSIEVPKTTNAVLNTTFEKDDVNDGLKTSKTIEKIDIKQQNDTNVNKSLNSTFEKRTSPRKSLNVPEKTTSFNGTFDLSPKPDIIRQKSLNSTFDKESKLNSTFDKPKLSSGSKSSLISSDATNSSILTLDKSDENSKINISDDSKTENILNTSPLLIESSMEESRVLETKSKTPESKSITPLKREGTFTKDAPELSMSPKQTPNKRQTLPAAGCTPYHSNGKPAQKRSVLNLTHSIEKPGRSSVLEAPRSGAEPRARVMFCSPVNNPGLATQRKTNIIKSNLKGSNKSFVFDESMSSLLPERSGRKRSFTHTEGEAPAQAKRSRLAPASAPQRRARTASQPTKPTSATTPAKTPTRTTPSKPRSDVKTKLPNFAALHARRFERMESLDECQQRRAQRARQLLVPSGSLTVLERSSPRVTLEAKPRDTPPKATTPAKPATQIKPASKLPTLDTLQRGYTRFGFKMHCDVNPFSVPNTTNKKPKEIKPNGLKVKPVVNLRQVAPSLAGATSLRREAAKQTIMREKSFNLVDKRNETRKEVRTVIKGVRTNRRFELQMKSRNING